jgi:hypothetical protein
MVFPILSNQLRDTGWRLTHDETDISKREDGILGIGFSEDANGDIRTQLGQASARSQLGDLLCRYDANTSSAKMHSVGLSSVCELLQSVIAVHDSLKWLQRAMDLSCIFDDLQKPIYQHVCHEKHVLETKVGQQLLSQDAAQVLAGYRPIVVLLV